MRDVSRDAENIVINSNNLKDATEEVLEIYRNGDNCIAEMLSVISAPHLSIEDCAILYGTMLYKIMYRN